MKVNDAMEQRAWSEAGYADIVAAAPIDDDLQVEFANGDVILVSRAALGIPDGLIELQLEHEGLSLKVTTEDDQETDASWTQIRAAVDPTFAQELRRRDMEESRRLGLRLRALREDRNLSQRDLAGVVGMSAPQLSKIENGSYDLRVSTVRALLRAMGATFADIATESAPEVSLQGVRKFAKKVGMDPDLIDQLLRGLDRGERLPAIERLFGWGRDQLLAMAPPTPHLGPRVAFKRIRKDAAASEPFVRLATEVAALVSGAAAKPAYSGIPSSPVEVRRVAADDHGSLSFEGLLEWTWRNGIPVIPLQGRGGFVAAALSSEGGPTIVLKEPRDIEVYWLFDLAHELGHVACGHVQAEGVVDVGSPLSDSGSDDEENQATAFALELLLPNHELLVEEVRRESNGSHVRFKFAALEVAARARVNPAIMAMVAAYSLTEVGEPKDRWGSATNIALEQGSGRPTAERVAAAYVNKDSLSGIDAYLVERLVLPFASLDEVHPDSSGTTP
jgi:DNA-binding XRE family transcriptional regulator/Zn-dependent peptidase ImmA (M78 family)